MAAFSLMQSSEARPSNFEQSFGSQDGLPPDDRYNEVIAILVLCSLKIEQILIFSPANLSPGCASSLNAGERPRAFLLFGRPGMIRG